MNWIFRNIDLKLTNMRWVTLLCSLLISFSAFSQHPNFRATANKSQVPLNGTVRVTFTLENVKASGFQPPKFTDFDAYGPSTGNNMSWVNGKMTQSTTYTYTLKPQKEGEFNIEPAFAKIEGKLSKSNTVSIKVVAATAAQNNQGNANNNSRNTQPSASNDANIQQQIKEALFVRAIPSKREVFEGEQLTITYKVYYRLSLEDMSILKMPSFDGFLSHDIEITDEKRQRKVETYNGQQFNTSTFHQIALFPSRTGEFTIKPMELQSVISIRQNDPRSWFPRIEHIKHELKSNGFKVKVNPLPVAGKPAGYTGAVGKLNFSASYDKTETKVDDPITLKIKVSGQGNIKLIDVPVIDLPQSFEVYDPKIKENISKKSYTVNGSKSYEYLIIPRGGGEFQFPDINFSYFDLDSKQYVTKSAPGPLITVEGEAISNQDFSNSGLNKEEIQLLGDDIKFIKTGDFIEPNSQANIISKPIFHLLTWVPLFFALFIPFLYRQRKKQNSDLALVKSKKAHKEAAKRMAAAKKLIGGEDSAFYNEIVKSIWGYLADKFNIPAADLSKDKALSTLTNNGISEALQKETSDLIDQCEMAIYAPLTATDSREVIIQKAEHLISELHNEINKS